jgi:tRNA pseudouridine32 synthase/23S rRNA pseudouridine746 synthase
MPNGALRGPGAWPMLSERPGALKNDGVGWSVVALPPGPWVTVLDFLAERFATIPREEWQRRLEAGEVLSAQGQPIAPDATYHAPAKLHYRRHVPDERPLPVEETVLFHDEHLVVADKPHFLPVTPSGRHLRETLLVRLRRRLDLPELAPVHRIDRETAGLVLFSVRPETRGAYQGVFRERRAEKVYEAMAPWRDELALPLLRRSRLEPAPHFMQMHEVPGEPNAETHIALVERRGPWARYELRPHTGRRHQLRVQMAALGLPLAGDRIYPVLQPDEPAPDFSNPLRLLARTLAFDDPVTGEARRFESRLVLHWPI